MHYDSRIKVVAHHGAYWAKFEVWCGEWLEAEYLQGMSDTIEGAIDNLRENMEFTIRLTQKRIAGTYKCEVVDGNGNILKKEDY